MNLHPESRSRPLGSYNPEEDFLVGWAERASVAAACEQLKEALLAGELGEVGRQSVRIGLPYAVTNDRSMVLENDPSCVRWLEQLATRLVAAGPEGTPRTRYADLIAARNVVLELLSAVSAHDGLPAERLGAIARQVSPGSDVTPDRATVTRLLTTLRDRLSEHLPLPAPGRFEK